MTQWIKVYGWSYLPSQGPPLRCRWGGGWRCTNEAVAMRDIPGRPKVTLCEKHFRLKFDDAAVIPSTETTA